MTRERRIENQGFKGVGNHGFLGSESGALAIAHANSVLEQQLAVRALFAFASLQNGRAALDSFLQLLESSSHLGFAVSYS